MEINFYQTIDGNLVQSAIKLIEKIYKSAQRCVFFSPLEERVTAIDKSLWTFSTNSFIPHGDKNLGFKEQQPIYFTNECENPNNAIILIIMDSLDYKKYAAQFEKIILIFENKETSESAQKLFWDLKKNQENVNYWQQSSEGWKCLT